MGSPAPIRTLSLSIYTFFYEELCITFFGSGGSGACKSKKKSFSLPYKVPYVVNFVSGEHWTQYNGYPVVRTSDFPPPKKTIGYSNPHDFALLSLVRVGPGVQSGRHREPQHHRRFTETRTPSRDDDVPTDLTLNQSKIVISTNFVSL